MQAEWVRDCMQIRTWRRSTWFVNVLDVWKTSPAAPTARAGPGGFCRFPGDPDYSE